MGEKISISRERLDELFKAEKKLKALNIVGVDNWEGYDYAMDILKKWGDEDNE